MPDDNRRHFLSHVELPLLTPRKRAAFPPPPPPTRGSGILNSKNKRVRLSKREHRDESDEVEDPRGPLSGLGQAEVTVVDNEHDEDEADDDGEVETVQQGRCASTMPIVEYPQNQHLKLHGTGLTKPDLEEIRSTLGPLEKVVIDGKNHLLSIKHLRQYFYWLAERQRIYQRRKEGLGPIRNIVFPQKYKDRSKSKDEDEEKVGTRTLPCWSLDPLFAQRTSNTYRHQDTDSHFIIHSLVRSYRPTPTPSLAYRTSGEDDRYDPTTGEWVDSLSEQVFRVCLFWRFGKQATWKWFVERLGGDVRWKTYDYKKYYRVLLKKKETYPDEALFTGAYQIHPDKGYGCKTKQGKSCPAGNAIKSVEAFMTGYVPFLHPPKKRNLGAVPERLAKMTSYHEAFLFLRSFPGMGNYHALQLALDLNYTTFINLSYTSASEWMACGRGAVNGLNLIIPTAGGRDKDVYAGLVWLRRKQWDEWDRLGWTPCPDVREGVMPPGMKRYEGVDLVDIENSLCLYQKYARYLRNTELYHMARGDNPELDWIGSSPWDPHRGEDRHRDQGQVQDGHGQGRLARDLVVRPEERGNGELKFWARAVQEFREEVESVGVQGGVVEGAVPQLEDRSVMDVDEKPAVDEEPVLDGQIDDDHALNRNRNQEQDQTDGLVSGYSSKVVVRPPDVDVDIKSEIEGGGREEREKDREIETGDIGDLGRDEAVRAGEIEVGH